MKQTRSTAAKREILALIKSSESALSHSDIQSSMQGKCDRVTIYRVLDRLLEENEVHKILGADNSVKYASCHTCTDHHMHEHVHFNCVNCKQVKCLTNVEPKFTMPANYKILDVNFTVSGICAKCQE